MPNNSYRFFVAFFLLVGLTPAQGQSPTETGTYQVLKTFHVGGEGGWDYLTVDSERGLLYVPRSTHTLVLDATSGKTVADIPGQKRNHGVALANSVSRGFITDGEDGSVTIFDLKSNQVLGKIKAAEDADGIIYEPVSRKVLVSCGDAGVLIAIPADVDPKTGQADPPIALSGKPEFLAAAEGKAYVNLVDKDQVAVIDLKAMKVIQKWPTAPGGSPVGLSMDSVHHRLFIGCRNPQKLIVMSSDDGKILADLPIGAGVDATQCDGDIFTSCRDGTLAVARETSPGKFEIVQTVQTREGARTMGIDPKKRRIFLPTAEFGEQKDARGRPVPKPDSFMILMVGQESEKTKPTAETEKPHTVTVKPLTQEEQDKLLAERLNGGMGYSFRQFANMFLVTSRIKLSYGIGLMTSSRKISEAELQPAFPKFYKPTLREFLDAIALQTSSQWKYDPTNKYVQSDTDRGAIDGLAIFEFTETKREKPYQIDPAKGWKTIDRGNWVMHIPPIFPVGMDIYEFGSYSSEDGTKEEELMKKVVTEVSLEWAKRAKEEVDAKELTAAKVGSYDALYFEAMVPMPGGTQIRWRQWVFAVGNQCYFVVSTILPKNEDQLYPEVQAMLKSFKMKKSEAKPTSP